MENSLKDEGTKAVRERLEGEPTFAFRAASWAAILLGTTSYLMGLFNAHMMLNEKGYYFTLLVFGLYAAVSLQKAVRDREENIPVTNIYYGISWVALCIALALMAIGLWNAKSIVLSEKGFYAMSFALSLFSAITVQKNIRDTQNALDNNSRKMSASK